MFHKNEILSQSGVRMKHPHSQKPPLCRPAFVFSYLFFAIEKLVHLQRLRESDEDVDGVDEDLDDGLC